jgi:hypothetical protein
MLAGRTGTELYARELASTLLERGHTPIVYSSWLGPLAESIREQTIPVVDDLEKISVAPDIIHGQHNLETMTALLRFPGVPAIYFSHANLAWQDVPPRFPRILRYVAVDDTCRDRLVFEQGIPAERVRVVSNSVDLKRFAQRPPLPISPRRGLIFGNDHGAHIDVARQACANAGIELNVIGADVGQACDRPEDVLGNYDIVFAKGRCALEALAVGTAVVLCGQRGLGPLVTSDDLSRLRALNFGHRALRYPFKPEVLAREIARYDPRDAAEVSHRVRAEAGHDLMIDEILALYDEVLEEFAAAPPVDFAGEELAVSVFLRTLTLTWNKEQELTQRSTTVRLRNRLLRVPGIGRLGLKAVSIYRRRTRWGHSSE